MNWHQADIEDIFKELHSSRSGLSEADSRERLRSYGPNVLEEKKKRTPFMSFLAQFKDFMILVLIAAAILSGIIGDVSDTIAILVIVVLNAIIGFAQEYKAERAMAALKSMAAPMATCVRDGKATEIAASELVPGDVVVLETGRIVPSDMRLFETVRLKIEEAALTGESIPVEKSTGVISDESVSVADRRNMAFKGTIVSYGRGKGIVVATGMRTELGRIATMLQQEDEMKTPLQKRLAAFGQKLSIAIIAICGIIFAVGLIRGVQPLLMLLTAISLAVAAIPEALPAVVTISLALGARKMVRQNALIRSLPAVETLGSVTYICSDKTGTLTLNRMVVEEIYVGGKMVNGMEGHEAGGSNAEAEISALPDPRNPRTPESFLMIALALCNDATANKDGKITGDPTETALYNIARDKGFDKSEIEDSFPRITEVPFDSDRKCMTTIHEGPRSKGVEGPSERRNYSLDLLNPGDLESSDFVSFTKGAVEVILDKSVDILTMNGLEKIASEEIKTISERMAADGLRVLAVGFRRWDAVPDTAPESVEKGLTFLGVVGLMDPPREEAKEAVRICRSAGIRPVMITGDHPVTAKTIARRIGFLEDDSKELITGKRLSELSLEEFEERVEHIGVYARVAPEQKLRIIKVLQDRGQFIAMTGDGVNDAPALKRADIGVAMGITGTDVAKEASDMILLDDNFATIVKAIKEGRTIYDNIRKFVKYLLTTNSGEIWTLFLAPLIGLPIPLLPIHILWINLMTDALPALALSVEPAEGDVMSRPPRPPKESIFAHGLGLHAIWVGLLMAGTVLFVQAWSIRTEHAHWQTMVFTVLCLTQLGHVLAIRSERESLFKLGLLSNKFLLGAVALSFVFQMATVYVPFLNAVFRTEPLSPDELILTLAFSSIIFFAVEAEKWWKRRMHKRQTF